MKILLDTHVLLWWLQNDSRLKPEWIRLIRNQRNACFLSSATIWEIGIKVGLGKLQIPEGYLDIARSQGFIELPVSWKHADTAGKLPFHHHDPFDRMLIAQAITDDLLLLTSDAIIELYDVRTG